MRRTLLGLGLLVALAAPARAQAPRLNLTVEINRQNPWDRYIENLSPSIGDIRCPDIRLTLKVVGLGGEFPVVSPGITNSNGQATLVAQQTLTTMPLYHPPQYMISRCWYNINPVIPLAGATYHVILEWVCPGGLHPGLPIGGWNFYTNQASWSASTVGVFNAKSPWVWFAQSCGYNVDNWWPWNQFLMNRACNSFTGACFNQCATWEGGVVYCP